MTNATVTGNVSPPAGPAGVFVGTFGPGSATLNVVNSIIADNVTEGCFLAQFGPGAVAINSLGHQPVQRRDLYPGRQRSDRRASAR